MISKLIPPTFSIGAVTCVEKPWEGKVFKKNVFQLTFDWFDTDQEIPLPQLSGDLSKILNELKNFCPYLALVRFPASVRGMSAVFEKTGFNLIECYLVFRHSLMEIPRLSNKGAIIRTVNNEDVGHLETIASQNLKSSRFHSDIEIDQKLADFSRAEWIKNSCNGYAKEVFVADVDSSIAGFLACRESENNGDRYGILDLMAVDNKFRRRRIGSDLTLTFLKFCFQQHYKFAEVGTQAHNIAALRMYQKVGFEPAQTFYTFHRHTG